MKKLIGLFIVIAFNMAYSQIAIFPFEDLSKGVNGINMEISQRIAQNLRRRGYSVTWPREVANFLSRHHIMWTGWVDRVTADRIKRELNSQYALLGTVLEYNPKTFSFALTLRLLDLEDYKLIWSYSAFLSKEDNISFLSLRKRTWDSCLTHLMDMVVSNMPPEILKLSSKVPIVDVSRCLITPRYVRPKEKVSCRIKLESSGSDPDSVVLKVEGVGEVPLEKKGEFYEASWKSPETEGRFGVTLEVSWYGLKRKRIFLGTYFVDNTPPSLHIKLLGVRDIGGIPIMKNYVKIVPSIKRNEVIDRWCLEIVSRGKEGDKKVLSVSNAGYIPPWFIWKGQTGKGTVPNGRYLIRLTVWDKAGNSYTDEKEILVVNSIGNPQIDIYKDGKKDILLKVRIKDYPIGFKSWKITLWSEDGEFFQEKSGESSLDDTIRFPGLSSEPSKRLYCLVELVDEAGNRWVFRKGPLKPKKLVKVKTKKKGGGWVSDF